MKRLKVLLVDLTHYGPGDVAVLMRQHCDLTVITDAHALDESIQAAAPHALCFEYDYPDMPRLVALRKAKQTHRSLPLLMITEQHSEALAVWALRSRVWDYFVKPLAAEPFLRCLDGLGEVLAGSGSERRPIVLPSPPIPVEARFNDQTPDGRVLRGAVDHVLANLHENITQAEVAVSCQMSSSQFSRAFKHVYGMTFRQFLIEARLEAAAKLLRNPSANVADVSWAVGFHDHSYFTRMFRRHTGATPSQYRSAWLEQQFDRVAGDR